jgi:predicted nucleic acid-binding protein
MIVLDASVLANVVADDGHDGAKARKVLASAEAASVPDLADVETVAVLRRRWRTGTLSEQRFAEAVADLVALPLMRYPTRSFLHRTFSLRHNVTSYDACYVALAETLQCELVTADARLSRATGLGCPVRVINFA